MLTTSGCVFSRCWTSAPGADRREPDAGVASGLASFPPALRPLRSHKRHRGGLLPQRLTNGAFSLHVCFGNPVRNRARLSLPPASLWVGASLESFSCLKSLLYLSVNHFSTVSSHFTWFGAHPRLTVFKVTGNPRGTESALRGCCKCFPTFSAVAFCPVFCAMGKSLYLYGVKFISPFSYRLWILSHRPTFPTLANKKFTVWCHF